MLTLNDGRSELWQWDTNRKLTVDAECSQVHFSNKVFGRSIDVDVVDGVASIPDILLQTDKELTVWEFVGTPENGYTKISKFFKVNRRNKPADYVFTHPEQTTLAEIMERLEDIESAQDPNAIKNAVDGYLANNPIEETDPTVPEWAKKPNPPDVKIPDKLPNPHTLTFSGAVNASYDGSSAVEIEIPDYGGNVAYDEEQKLTEEQKERARTNIGAQPVGAYLTEVPEGYAKNEDIEKVDRKVDTLREVVSKFHSNIVCDASGDIIVLDDASDMELSGLRIFGKTTQNGTPTPDAPVPLESVGDSGSIKTTVIGKNLYSGGNLSFNKMLEITLKKPLSAGTYTFSAICSSNDSNSTLCGVSFLEGSSSGGNVGLSIPRGTRETRTIILERTVSQVRFYAGTNYDNSIGDSATYQDIQIEYGKVATEFEPYKAQTVTIWKPLDAPVFLPGIPVTSGGNYTDENGQQWSSDEVDFAGGKYVQRIGSIESYANQGVPGAYMSTTGTLSENATVLYVLPESIYHDLSAEELAQYAALHTNYPNTTVYNNGNAGMEVQYAADTKLYIDKKFAELSAALLNQ